MAGREGEEFKGPWPAGMNNRLRDAQLGGALRNTVNTNVTTAGGIVRRDGYELKVEAEYHSLWGEGGEFGLCVKNSALTMLEVSRAGAVTETTLRSGLTPGRRMAYVEANGAVYYSNGVITGRVVSGVDGPWGVEHARPPVAAAVSYGGMAAGIYLVAITYVLASGEEGGTSAAVAVTVAAGGGIQLSAIPQASSSAVTHTRVYLTAPNGAVFYHYGDLLDGVTAVTLARSATQGAELASWNLYPPPAGDVLELHNGSIFIANGPNLVFTEPLYFGQYRPTNHYAFPADISILASLAPAVLAVVADIHYLLPGADSTALSLRDSHRYPAVKGTQVKLPDNMGRMWMTRRGAMVGDASGALTPKLGDAVRIDEATEGAAIYREIDGQNLLITTLHDGAASSAAAQDYFDAEVIRRS